MKRIVVASLTVLAACGPKGSNKPATLEKTSIGFIVRHPNFEGHLDPSVVRQGSGWSLKLEFSSLPEKSIVTAAGKSSPPARSGQLEQLAVLDATIGDAPIAAFTGGSGITLNVPFEVSLFGGRQKVSGTIERVSAYVALSTCLKSPPCTFGVEPSTPPSPKPNILYFPKGTASEKIVGSPARVRDIDLIAKSEETPPVQTKKCKMTRSTTSGVDIPEEMTLVQETERVVAYDRRSGAKLRTKDLTASDVCPFIASVKLTGEKAGLRNEVDAAQRARFFDELRGEAAPLPTPATKPTKPGSKK